MKPHCNLLGRWIRNRIRIAGFAFAILLAALLLSFLSGTVTTILSPAMVYVVGTISLLIVAWIIFANLAAARMPDFSIEKNPDWIEPRNPMVRVTMKVWGIFVGFVILIAALLTILGTHS